VKHFIGWHKAEIANFKPRIIRRAKLAQLGADTRNQLAKPKRLGDIIISASFKPKNNIALGALGGEHNNGFGKTVAAQTLANINAITIGHLDIKENQIRVGMAKRIVEISNNTHLENIIKSLNRKLLPQGRPKIGIIINN
jgi:hypothetical protein